MSSEALAWVTAEFMEKVLKNSESDPSIEVKDLKTKPALGKGENYGSDMIRANVKYLRDKSGSMVMETMSVIIKISPMADGATKEVLKKFESFELEINMVQTTLAKMNDILNEKDYRLNARVLYAEIGEPSFLVLEDLAPLGYRMANRLVGLDLEHCLLVMKNLAKFHGSSVAVCEKADEGLWRRNTSQIASHTENLRLVIFFQDPKPKTFYNKGLFHANHAEDWKQFCKGGMKRLAKELLNWPELGANRSSYSEKLLRFSAVCYDKAIECVNKNGSQFAVLNHGDFWINNMLFRYDSQGKLIDQIFVDFQTPVWNSPAIDILNLFSTSLAEDVDLHHREALLKEYLNMLTKTMSRLRCKTKPPTMEALEKILKDYELYGVMSSCLFLPVTLLDNSEFINFDEIIRDDDVINPAYKGQAFRKIMVRRLPVWIERGLIDD